jgi:hypothetical protein
MSKTPRLIINDDKLFYSSFQNENIRKFDYNDFATKKTVAKGLMDVALLSTNTSQLKVCLQLGPERQEFYYLLMMMLSISIILQTVIAVLLIYLGKSNITSEGSHVMSPKQKRCKDMNDAATVIVLVITFLNVIISSFGVGARGC